MNEAQKQGMGLGQEYARPESDHDRLENAYQEVAQSIQSISVVVCALESRLERVIDPDIANSAQLPGSSSGPRSLADDLRDEADTAARIERRIRNILSRLHL